MDPLFALLVALCLTLLFGAAAIAKLRDLAAFEATLAAYALLPAPLVPAASRLVPALETLLAVGWLVRLDDPLLAWASAALLVGYALAMAVNLRRGRIDLSCGCSFGSSDPISWWLVARNLALALFALLPALPASGRSLSIADLTLAAAAVPALVFLHLAVQQLIANGTAMARGRDPAGAER
ncbi:MAG TPA: MauE/DoxX family redox-associated membrane protein [Pseudomonadales bacterium]